MILQHDAASGSSNGCDGRTSLGLGYVFQHFLEVSEDPGLFKSRSECFAVPGALREARFV
jgi:hypothetical protein